MNAKLNQDPTGRIYVNHVFGKNVNGMIGPVYRETKRCIFAQAKAGSKFWEVGEIDIVTGEITAQGADNLADAQKVINSL